MQQYQRQSIVSNGPTPPNLSRKRKRAMEVSWSEVQEQDTSGVYRDYIIIEDTPPPTMSSATSVNGGYSASYQPPHYSAPIRTRARAAAEAQAISSGSSSSTILGPPAKKRKREQEEVRARPTKKATVASHHALVPTSTKKPAVTQAVAASTDATKGASCDDKEGHYIIVPDDIIKDRYRTVRLLGQGTFGKVVEAVDTRTNTRVAIKIIRAVQKYRDASKIEVRVLQRLKERDPMNRNKCVHLTDWFDHKAHICLVTELLGICVYDFLKDNDFAPFPRHHIQSFARQLLGSVAFLHELKLVHTDLKPENILLVNNAYNTIPIPQPQTGKRVVPPKQKRILASTDIRLIDFGSATFETEYHSTVVSTRHYRAPEIILGLGWSYPCDAYSLGCILVEFYTGTALFQTHDNQEHLAMMEAVMTKMPAPFARLGARAKPEYFTKDGKLQWPSAKATRQSKKDVKATKSLAQIIQPTDRINVQFLNLVSRLLAFDPAQRITVKEALNHPYFTMSIPEEI
ncbi:kinase-like protein [Cylindrobasidium torrendii FP15055 ss-10]|uniref:Kinase-like protein n=1 Tax=Cylindrobasidium torrendii FP15055 ss-10 TaxID=1314674 RepID=A0A0D7BAH7_9AGAR|nr:kinase-like protein [Cylindrobasidium torrendii FP15055 ss-10]